MEQEELEINKKRFIDWAEHTLVYSGELNLTRQASQINEITLSSLLTDFVNSKTGQFYGLTEQDVNPLRRYIKEES
jgi:hypothetical protein